MATARKSAGPFAVGLGWQGIEAHVGKAGAVAPSADLRLGEAEPHVSHLLLVVTAIVGQHVHDEHAAARRSDARGFRDGAPGIGHVMQHERQHGDVELLVVHRQRFERAAPHLHVGHRGQVGPRGRQHLGRRIDGDDAGDIRGDQRTELAGAAPEIADAETPVEHREHRLGLELLAEEFGAQPIPLPRGRREELRRLRAALGQHGFGAAGVLLGGRGLAGLFANQRPQPRGRLVEGRGQTVVARSAIATRDHPAVVGQGLEVAADGRLRQLQHGAQLGDRQLEPLEQDEQPAAHGIGEGRHVLQQPRQAAAGVARLAGAFIHP